MFLLVRYAEANVGSMKQNTLLDIGELTISIWPINAVGPIMDVQNLELLFEPPVRTQLDPERGGHKQ